MKKRTLFLTLTLMSGSTWASGVTENTESKAFWQVQTSVYTRHFSPSPEHNNHQRLIGLERNEASGWLYGAATFRNSFDQQSIYAYAGKRFESTDHPFYAKLSAGLIYGYRGEYRDKIPLNRFGLAPALIPGVGARMGPVIAEALLLGTSAVMINLGVRF